MLVKINKQIEESLKNKDELRLSVLRAIKTAIGNEAIALKKKDEGLSEEESLKIIKREANKRKDAYQAFIDGGRKELAEKEEQELQIVEEFLPEQLSEEALGTIVEEIIAKVGASGAADFGKVMGPVMDKVGARADGNAVSKVVKEKLS